jgi:hypothetical protein
MDAEHSYAAAKRFLCHVQQEQVCTLFVSPVQRNQQPFSSVFLSQ